MINATEWCAIKNIPPEVAELFSCVCAALEKPKPEETLGLRNRNGAVRPGNFIGAVRIGDCFLLVYDSGEKL